MDSRVLSGNQTVTIRIFHSLVWSDLHFWCSLGQGLLLRLCSTQHKGVWSLDTNINPKILVISDTLEFLQDSTTKSYNQAPLETWVPATAAFCRQAHRFLCLSISAKFNQNDGLDKPVAGIFSHHYLQKEDFGISSHIHTRTMLPLS